jgi:paraquat-inducible protein B
MYIIHIPEGYTVRPVHIGDVVQEAPSQSQAQISSHLADRLSDIRDILTELMSSDEIANDSYVYQRLKDAEELIKGMTYVRRGGSGSSN